MTRSRSVTLWSYPDGLMLFGGGSRGAMENRGPLKETAVWKAEKCILFGKKLCLLYTYCLFSYCVKYNVYVIRLTSHNKWRKPRSERLTGMPRAWKLLLSSSLTLSAQTQLQWGPNVYTLVPPPPLMKNPQGKCSYSFYWPQSIIMLPFKTSGGQTSQKKSLHAFFSRKFIQIWCKR